MERDKYLAQRKELLDSAEILLNDLKNEEAKEKMAEVETLDAKFNEANEIKENVLKDKLNSNALNNEAKPISLENESITNLNNEKEVEKLMENKNVIDEKKAYENAWAKEMQGQTLTDSERKVFDTVNREFNNAYTHDTSNTSVLIPETVVAGIWKRAAEMYPLLADVKKFNVRGTLTLKKHTAIAAGDAAFYSEGTATTDEQNTFAEVSLSGCELSKAITITWKLRSMATEEFIPYIQEELAERIGVALGASVAIGKGSSATPREPQGIETALLAEGSTPQVVSYDPEATPAVPLSYSMFTSAIGKIHSSYLAGASIYASNSTIWNQLANLVDGQGRPLFIPDVTSGGVGRMFGMVVKADAGVTAGSVIIGNPNQGYVMNTNEPLSVATEEHVKARTVDYAAYTVVDGVVMDTKAFALIRNTPTA